MRPIGSRTGALPAMARRADGEELEDPVNGQMLNGSPSRREENGKAEGEMVRGPARRARRVN